jgi:hypothetical protein
VHYLPASQWLAGKDEPVFFCRFAQLDLRRLLTNEQVMGADVLTERKTWHAYRR